MNDVVHEMAIAQIASSQWGLVTTAQASARGVHRLVLSRMERSGRLERLEQGVYRHASVPTDQYTRLHAAWLSLNPSETAEQRLLKRPFDAVVSHETAAWLLEAGDFVPEPYRFCTPSRRQTQRPSLRLSTRRYEADAVVIRQGLPTTDLCQTAADLVAADADLSLVSGMFLHLPVERSGEIDRERLAALLGPYASRFGHKAGDGRALCDEILGPRNRSLGEAIQRLVSELASCGGLVRGGAPQPEGIAGSLGRLGILRPFEEDADEQR